MRRTPRILLATLLCSLGTADALAQGGPLDARNIKPAVMLLVDTSGSMERLPATAALDESPLPTCTGNTTQDSLQKNRWALTLEALTGSFQSFTCQETDRSSAPFMSTDYDYGYYLPHINFGTSPQQNQDGILDSFANRMKFGLMTFDGVGTTINGETLVGINEYTTEPFISLANGAPGMYSYGEVRRLSFPGCPTDYGVNAGARGEGTHPGALISVGLSENNDDVLAINARIQSSLLSVRPFGGTPIPAMLDDLQYYIQNHADINHTEPFYQCRARTAILITDGAPDALFRDSRFQCDTVSDSVAGTGQTCASNSRADAGVSGGADAGVPDGGTTTTAGGPECECPYKPAPVVAEELLRDGLLEKLIVVAYNVQDPDALAILETIAYAGWPRGTDGTDEETALGTTEYPYLVRANGPDELRNKISAALRGRASGVTSRSVPISVNTGNVTTGPDSKRFDVSAGFEVGEDEDQPWRGYLYRRRVTCEDTTVNDQTDLDATLGDEFHTSLNSQTSRDLFTVTPQTVSFVNGTLYNTAYRPIPVYDSDSTNFDPRRSSTTYDEAQNHRTPSGGTFPTSALVADDTSMSSNQALATTSINARVAFDNSLVAPLFGGTTTDAGRQRIVDYVRGTSRADRVLADIYHSNPVALLPLNSASTARFADINAAYSNWLRKIIAPGTGARYGTDGRPGVVFVGTNDGVLHAFNLDDWRTVDGDTIPGSRELWGFVPPALFGKMGAMAAPAHQYMFDGTPEVKDVVLQDRRDDTLGPIFRTILVSALRGAPAFVALDVTHPETPVFMWQTTFADVGETIGNPALTQVEVDWENERQQRAIAILPGGRGLAATSAACPTTGGTGHVLDANTRAEFPAGNTRNVRCWQRRGRGLYVVDVTTGQLLQAFGPEHFPSPITGSVVVDSAGVGTASAAYVFDHDGVLWRLSMVGPDPRAWRVAPIFDMFDNPRLGSGVQSWQAGRVPQYTPALTRDRQGNLVILAGTGEVDNPVDNAYQRVISVTELREPESDGQIGGRMQLNWFHDLDTYESVTGPLTVFENVVYFGTFTSQATANQCALGVSYLYGAHAYEPLDPTTRPGPPQPKLEREGAAATDPLVLRDPVPGSNLVMGLTVTRQPTCRNTSGLINSITQQSTSGPTGGGLYQLRAMMAGSSSAGRTGGAATRELDPRTIPVSHPSNVSSWAGAVE
jgi:type IV pilus assembly protein PilY1